MTFLNAIILGLLEGLTEFLPVSSTGHLLAAAKALGIPSSDFVTSFIIYIQLGAILAVAVLYIKKLLVSWPTMLKIISAFIPTAIIGLLLYPIIKKVLLESLLTVAIALIAGGIFLIVFEYWHKCRKQKEKHLSLRRSFLVGVFQALAVIPGVSRSGATVIGGMFLGISRKDIVEFSFLLAMPTMAAATGLDILESGFSFSRHEWLLIGVGFIVAFISALFAIKWFLAFVSKHSFSGFGWYRIAIGLIILIFLL